MPKKIEEVEVKQEVKEEVKGFIAYADFEFRRKQYKAGDVFQPPHDVFPDPNLDDFRRVNSKKNPSRGRTFYYEIPSNDPEKDAEVKRVILPVE